MGYSVTSRANSVKQPPGGYIKPAQFKTITKTDGFVINPSENVHGIIIGLVVDYLTRFLVGKNKDTSFDVSLQGAQIAEESGIEGSEKVAKEFLDHINGIDNESVKNACKLVTFDVWRRNPAAAMMSKSYQEINPDEATVQNIQAFVKRGIAFFNEYGPIVRDGFTFEPEDPDIFLYEEMKESGEGSFGGYTAVVQGGDGDFLTADTLWDFKVSKAKPTNKNTLQLFMYWIMGQHSGQHIYKNITKIGIFNPRYNTVYLLDVKSIPEDVIKTVEKEVICYE